MRLTSVIAERFGRLESATLGDLSPGLTIVVGPNEAGKTSFSALVRHVLYGYPTKREAEPGYESLVGKRLGRLVFTDGTGVWAVERGEGPHGGTVAVHTLAGPEREQLLGEVTAGVSREAFRIVFGFGLEELAAIEAKKDSGDDILSPLYAAQVGLATSPAEVRRSLAAEAEALWVKGGSVRELNALSGRINEVRAGIAGLEASASAFADDRRRLEALETRLGEERKKRDDSQRRASELVSAAQRLEELRGRAERAGERVRREEQRATESEAEALAVELDERVEAVASELHALLDDVSLYKERLERAREHEREAADADRRAALTLEEAGLSPDAAAAVDVTPAARATLDSWRDRLAHLTSQAATTRRSAETAEDAARAAASPTSPPGRAATSRFAVALSAMVALLGVAVAGAGALDGAVSAIVLGGIVFVTGAALLVQSARGTLGPPVSTAERTAILGEQARAARATAERDAAALEAARAEWRGWLAAAGLSGAGEDPGAVATVMAAVKEYRAQVSESQRLEVAAGQAYAECAEYRERLTRAVRTFIPGAETADPDAVPSIAGRAREMLDAAVEARAARQRIAAELEGARREAEAASGELEVARAESADVLGRYGFADSGEHALISEVEVASLAASEAVVAYDDAAAEYAELKGRLDAEGHDARMAELRLGLAGLEEQREVALERYAVRAVACRLMGQAQAFNERERQPAVVRRTSEIFECITDGRYSRVAAPGDDGRFHVFDAAAERKDTSELSTGTAQQLYLAVRIALVEQLDGVGPGLPVLMDDVLVNFDGERRTGTARAVAELSSHRQVVLFTCHPEIAEVFSLVGAAHELITLDRC